MVTNRDMWKWGLLALCLAVISAVDARFCSDSSNVIKPQSPDEAVAATEDLWRAVAMNDVGWAKAAIARGADLDSRRPMVDSTNGSTPLHLAAWMGHIPVTVALAAAGADLEAKNEFDRTPIFEAAMNNRPEEVEILVALGADVTAKNKWGRGVMHLAAYGEDPTVIGVLLKAGADLSSGDNSGDTPLHLAIEDGNLEVVKAIVGFGASVKRRNNAGVTPLKKALENKRYAIAEYIRSTGGYE